MKYVYIIFTFRFLFQENHRPGILSGDRQRVNFAVGKVNFLYFPQ